MALSSFALHAQDKAQQEPQTPPAKQTQQQPAPPPSPLPVRIEGAVRLEREQSVEPDWDKLKCGEAKSHDEADLCEQRRMAKSAEDSVFWNRVQVAVAIVGFGLVLWSLYYSRVATRAAVSAAVTAEKAMFEVEAPFLYPDKISHTIVQELERFSRYSHDTSPIKPAEPTVYFNIKNFGAGAAIFQSYRAAVSTVQALKELSSVNLGPLRNSPFPIIEPKESIADGIDDQFRIRLSPTLDREGMRKLKGGVIAIIFHGEIQFSGVHGANYIQTFGFHYEPVSKSLLPMDGQNNRRRQQSETKQSKQRWQFWK